jgi:hypothetical protein
MSQEPMLLPRKCQRKASDRCFATWIFLDPVLEHEQLTAAVPPALQTEPPATVASAPLSQDLDISCSAVQTGAATLLHMQRTHTV